MPVALLASAADAALLWGIRSFMKLLSGESFFTLWEWLLVMILLSVLRLVFLFWKTRQTESWTSSMGAAVLGWYLRTLRNLSPRVFHTPKGDSMVEEAYEATVEIRNNGNVFFQAVQAGLQLAVFLPVLVVISWPLTLFLFVVVVPLVAWMQRKLHALGPEEESLMFAKSELRGNLLKMRRMLRFWSAPFERSEMSDALLGSVKNLRDRNQQVMVRKGGLALVIETVSVLAMVSVLAFCALLMSKGWMNGEGLVLYCSAVLLCYKPVKECARVLPQFRLAKSAYNVLFRFGEAPRRKVGRLPVNQENGQEFRINDGSFGYEGSEATVYSKLNMALDAEKPVLLRGRNGAGKSTLLRLMAGLEEWEKGNMKLPARADNAGVFFMAQDLELPPRSLLQDLLSRSDSPDLRRFIQAARAEKLLNKEGLSGGERARVALVWALASRSVVLLLDEPFASVALVDREPLLNEFLQVSKALGKWVIVSSHDSLSPAQEEMFFKVDLSEIQG